MLSPDGERTQRAVVSFPERERTKVVDGEAPLGPSFSHRSRAIPLEGVEPKPEIRPPSGYHRAKEPRTKSQAAMTGFLGTT